MSNRALTWAWSLRIPSHVGPGVVKLTSGAKFVLIRLADAANDDFECWPSQELIAAETGFSERSVRTHLDLLVELGLVASERITKRNGARKGTRYRLAPESTSVTVVIATEDTGENQVIDDGDAEQSEDSHEIGLPEESAGRDLPVDNSENLAAEFSGRSFSGASETGDLPANSARLPEEFSGRYRNNPNLNHHSSSSDVDLDSDAAAVPPEEDQVEFRMSGAAEGVRLRLRWPFFDLQAVMAALAAAGIIAEGLRPIETITEEVLLGRAVSPRAVTAYVTTAIVSEPWRWAAQPATLDQHQDRAAAPWDCDRDGHDWGPSVWAEIDRCVCVRCDELRRHADPVFADLEADVRGFARAGTPSNVTPSTIERHMEEVS